MVEVDRPCPKFFTNKFPPPCLAILLTYLDEKEIAKTLTVNKHSKKLRDNN